MLGASDCPLGRASFVLLSLGQPTKLLCQNRQTAIDTQKGSGAPRRQVSSHCQCKVFSSVGIVLFGCAHGHAPGLALLSQRKRDLSVRYPTISALIVQGGFLNDAAPQFDASRLPHASA